MPIKQKGGNIFDPGHALMGTANFLATITGMKPEFTPEQVKEINAVIIKQKDRLLAEQTAHEGRDLTEKLFTRGLDAKKNIANTNLKQMAQQFASTLSEQKNFHSRLAPSVIWKTLVGILDPLWKNAAPYVVLAVVIITLVVFMKNTNSIISNRRSNISTAKRIKQSANKNLNPSNYYIIRQIQKLWSWILSKFKKIIDKILAPLYRIRQFTGMISGGAHDNSPILRQRIESGRCDNLKWVETTAEGTKGYCNNSIHPIDLTWKIDTTKTPEYFDLPQIRKQQLENYLTVKIPWDKSPNATFYVPKCDKAYYPATCTKEGICQKADLFEDVGLACRLKDDKLPTQYPGPPNEATKNTFDNATIKSCININNLNDSKCS
jgi:hypothetical protein